MSTIIPIVQHVDTAKSARDYPEGDKLLVTSVFRTIQGEGPFAGHPAVFVRLAGCNYGAKDKHCLFCDTSFEYEQGQWFSYAELDDLIRASGALRTDVLVITGGEPTLQHNLVAFINNASLLFSNVQLETNGTQPRFFQELNTTGACLVNPSVVVSPKANYQTKKYPKVHDLVLENATCFKYVLSANPDDPHHTVPQDIITQCRAYEVPVYVSPMTVYLREYDGEVSSVWEDGLIDRAATAKNYAYAAEYALKHNLLISVQMHTFLGIA